MTNKYLRLAFRNKEIKKLLLNAVHMFHILIQEKMNTLALDLFASLFLLCLFVFTIYFGSQFSNFLIVHKDSKKALNKFL